MANNNARRFGGGGAASHPASGANMATGHQKAMETIKLAKLNQAERRELFYKVVGSVPLLVAGSSAPRKREKR